MAPAAIPAGLTTNFSYTVLTTALTDVQFIPDTDSPVITGHPAAVRKHVINPSNWAGMNAGQGLLMSSDFSVTPAPPPAPPSPPAPPVPPPTPPAPPSLPPIGPLGVGDAYIVGYSHTQHVVYVVLLTPLGVGMQLSVTTKPSTVRGLPLCYEGTCASVYWNSNGQCQDGGPGAEFSSCPYGGVRGPPQRAPQPCAFDVRGCAPRVLPCAPSAHPLANALSS